MPKFRFVIFLAVLTVIFLLPCTAFAQTDLPIYLDGELQEYSAVSRDGDILLPLKSVALAAGRDVEYLPTTQEILISAKHSVFTLKPGSTKVLQDGEEITPLDAAPYIHAGNTYLSVDETAELLGLDIVQGQEKVEIYTDFLYEVSRTGEPIMGHDSLYRISRNGDRLEVARVWAMNDYFIHDGYCYILGMRMMGNGEVSKFSIYEAYDYGKEIILTDPTYSYSLPAEGWTITDEGLKMIGHTNGIGEYYQPYMTIKETREASLESCGYYLLDLYGKGHQFIEHLEWPYELPPLMEIPQAQGPEIYLNGEKQDCVALVENERTLLPLRAICNMLDANIFYYTERREIQFEAQNSMFTMHLDSTQVLRDGVEIEPLAVPPYAWQGHVYLPIRYMAELLGADIVWNQELKRVEIYTEFTYEKIREGGYGVNSNETIWQVSPSGNRKAIFTDWDIADFVIKDGYCYALIMTRSLHGQIIKVSLYNIDQYDEAQRLILGNSDFSYGFSLYDTNDFYDISGGDGGVSIADMQKMEISEDGIIIRGYLADGDLGSIRKNDAVTQSYGVYLVDLNGNGHQLIEKLEPLKS